MIHSLLQRAERTAKAMPWRIVPLGSMLAAEKLIDRDWRFVCRFETEEEAVDFLTGKLTQEGPDEPLRG